MPGEEVTDIRELIKWARGYLQRKKIEHPQLVAELIAEQVTNKKRMNFYLEPVVPVDRKKEALFKKNIRRCGRKVPVAYVRGKQHFLGDVFFLRPGVFIPRPETEVLVEEAVKFIEKMNETHPNRSVTVVDVGTGCGNIAISIAKRVKNVFVLATDTSPLALQVAEENSRFHRVSSRVSFVCGDLLSPLQPRRLKGKIDVIVSNPPYIDEKKMRYLPEQVKKEPHFALNGGEKGLIFYKRIIPASVEWLRENGALILEIGYNQAEQIRSLVKKEYKASPRIFYDLEKKERVVLIKKDRNVL